MNKDRYSIIFNSKTGNTRKLADAIHEALPQENCDLFGAAKGDVPASETLYIGFWTDKGSADKATAELLAKLKNRKIFLFGTAGLGGSKEYFTSILDNVKKLIDESNTVVGEYMCQGRMPDSVRERYIKMKEQPDHMPNLDMLIENFDKALSHPDAADLDRLQKMVTA